MQVAACYFIAVVMFNAAFLVTGLLACLYYAVLCSLTRMFVVMINLTDDSRGGGARGGGQSGFLFDAWAESLSRYVTSRTNRRAAAVTGYRICQSGAG